MVYIVQYQHSANNEYITHSREDGFLLCSVEREKKSTDQESLSVHE